MTLRVGLIAETFNGYDGIARVGKQFVRALGTRPDVELVLALPEAVKGKSETPLPNNVVDVVWIPHTGRVAQAAWVRSRLGREFERREAVLLHASKHVLPVSGLVGVLTAHDLTLVHDADQFSLPKRLLLPRQYINSLERADLLLTHTDAVKDSISEYRPDWGSKTKKLGLPFGGEIFSQQGVAVEELKASQFCLVVGDLSPRKNIDLLIKIWPNVFKQTGMQLVLVGGDGWKSKETLRALKPLSEKGLARRVVGASDAMLRWMYEHATALLYPSREEGYGLPVIEALAVGTQVIISTDGSLMEVANGHALHVDPDDLQGWENAIIASGRALSAHHSPVVPIWVPTYESIAETLLEFYGLAISNAKNR